MKKRSAIDEAYKWDLSKFCQSNEEWYKKLEEVKNLIPLIKTFSGTLSNPDKLFEFSQLSKKMSLILGDLSMYSANSFNVDMENSVFVEMGNLLSGVTTEISTASAFFVPEMSAMSDEFFEQLFVDERFKNNTLSFKEILRNKPHIVSTEISELLSEAGNFAGGFSEVFDVLVDTNMTFEDAVDSKGNKMPLNHSSYGKYSESPDRVLRKSAFENYYKSFSKFSDTIATNFIANLKADWFYTKSAKFESVIESELFDINANKSLYDNLIKNVVSHTHLLQKYYKVKGKMLGLSDFTYYDQFVSSANINKKISYEKGIEVIKQALAPLGQEYVGLIDKSVKERWLDVYPNQNKTNGAYQWATYGKTPVVLLNHTDTLSDVFTIAHELGHAFHSYYSNANQPHELASYPIFLAEVASIVNEVLLTKYLYANSKNKKEKIYYLENYLQLFKGTLFRQTMFSQFEEFAHDLIQHNKPISKAVLTNYYKQLNQTYHGNSIKHKKEIEIEWLRIPHFYDSFYVYQYATGIVSAINLASKIFAGSKEDTQKYLNFLKSGGSDYPLNILKSAGVDLFDSKTYEVVFEEMKWAVSQLEVLSK